MTLSEIFFGRVEMPVRCSGWLVNDSAEQIRKEIEPVLARQLEERRREEERQRIEEAERARYYNPDIRYKTILSSPPIPACQTASGKKRPPNLNADVLSFSAQLLTFVNSKCDGRAVVAYKRSGINRNVYSRIVSDDSARVNKRTAMQFCIGLQLSRPEADQLLKSAGYAFSEAIPEDIAFAYFVDHSIWNLEDINEILEKCGLATIELPEK